MAINSILDTAALRLDLTSQLRSGSYEKTASTTTESSSLSAQQSDLSALSPTFPEAVSPAASVRLTTTFTQEVGNLKIPASVSESDGEYIATSPTPPGASAQGSTIEVAEYNLKVKLDAIV